MCDGLFVFIICRPYCYFISFGSDVNDSAAHVVAVIVKGFTHKTQELQENHTFQHVLLMSSSLVSVSVRFELGFINEKRLNLKRVTSAFLNIKKKRQTDCALDGQKAVQLGAWFPITCCNNE